MWHSFGGRSHGHSAIVPHGLHRASERVVLGASEAQHVQAHAVTRAIVGALHALACRTRVPREALAHPVLVSTVADTAIGTFHVEMAIVVVLVRVWEDEGEEQKRVRRTTPQQPQHVVTRNWNQARSVHVSPGVVRGGCYEDRRRRCVCVCMCARVAGREGVV